MMTIMATISYDTSGNDNGLMEVSTYLPKYLSTNMKQTYILCKYNQQPSSHRAKKWVYVIIKKQSCNSSYSY